MTRRVELGPGTYSVRNTATGVATDFTVPTLTVAITQASPTVGQTLTLTTNVNTASPATPVYQWTRAGVDIAGATGASYLTVSADSGQQVRCRVTSGAQVVTSAPVTVGAAAGLTRTYLGVATGGFASGVTERTITLPVTFTAGQRYVVAIGMNGYDLYPSATLTIGGTLFERRLVNGVDDDGAKVLLFEGVPSSDATTGVLAFGLSTTTEGATYFCYSITNTAVWQGGVVTTATSGNQRDASQNVGAGNLLIGVAIANQATGMTWAGLTADGDAAPSTWRGFAASAQGVALANPRTITADRVGTVSNSDGFQILAGCWSAS